MSGVAIPSPASSVGMLTCIVCDRNFDSAANDQSFDCIPYEGTLFRTRGHYGSTVFDSLSGDELEIIVCDACLIERRKRTALILWQDKRRVRWDHTAVSGIESPAPQGETPNG